jgi:phosphatidylserine/phosphatidylglycerophosphate/cardiolipin synthase-like enzyme
MRKAFAISLSAILVLFFVAPPVHSIELTLNNAPTQVYFSPNGGCTQAIVREITDAKSEILVQAYSFTSAPIAKALVSAHKRGVKMEAILDKSQRSERYTSAFFLVICFDQIVLPPVTSISNGSI